MPAPSRSAVFLPPLWWVVLDLAGAMLLGLGLLAWLEPSHPLASWLPAGAGPPLAMFGALLLAAAIFLLLKMLLAQRRGQRH